MYEFEVGQAVRCLNDKTWRTGDFAFVEAEPRRGERCIVSKVTVVLLRGEPTLALGLAEYPLFRGARCVFVAQYFRPEGALEMETLRRKAASLPTKARELAGMLP